MINPLYDNVYGHYVPECRTPLTPHPHPRRAEIDNPILINAYKSPPHDVDALRGFPPTHHLLAHGGIGLGERLD
jgi:hypothetical protein